jgi:hypothetical protein
MDLVSIALIARIASSGTNIVIKIVGVGINSYQRIRLKKEEIRLKELAVTRQMRLKELAVTIGILVVAIMFLTFGGFLP